MSARFDAAAAPATVVTIARIPSVEWNPSQAPASAAAPATQNAGRTAAAGVPRRLQPANTPSQIGTPIEVYAEPASLFVAGFIGSPAMNFLETRVAADGRLAIDGAALAPKIRLDPGRPVTVGIRPEHLATGGGMDVQVELVELLGADTLVHARLSDGKSLIVRLPGNQVPAAGDRLPIQAYDGAWHIFDSETGKRLGTA